MLRMSSHTRRKRHEAIRTRRNGSFAIPTRARQVADVSGAGDTVIATLAVAMSCGATVLEAGIACNRAAGTVIEELGISPDLPRAACQCRDGDIPSGDCLMSSFAPIFICVTRRAA